MTKLRLIATVVLMIPLTAAAESVAPIPDAPTPHKMAQWGWLATDGVVRGLDVYSTHRALGCGCNHEMILPAAVATHVGTMAMWSAGAVGVNWIISRELRRHGHERLAGLVWVGDIGMGSTLDMHNLALRSAEPKGLRRLGK